MHVVLHNGVVEDTVALFQVVGLLAIDNLHLALHHVDELLTLVGRELKVGTLLGIDVDDKRLHVTTGLLLRQRVVLHVLAGIGGTIRETDAAVGLAILGTGNHGSQDVVVVHKRTQSHTECTGYLDQRPS